MMEEMPPFMAARQAFDAATARGKAIVEQFKHHPPQNDETIGAHRFVRESALQLALVLEGLLPEGQEKEYALKAVREAMMWGNSAIAIYGIGPR